jgi:hypothetical protein
MNSTILDAQHLGFKVPSKKDEILSPPSLGRVSPMKKDLRKKQLIAYHGWLKSKPQTLK